jgi:hypothetical protein
MFGLKCFAQYARIEMDRFLELLFSSLFQRLFALLALVATIIWGKLDKQTKLSTPVLFVYGLVAAAAVSVILNQIGWGPPTKIQIRQWLDHRLMKVTDLSDARTTFSFEVTDWQGRKFYIGNRKDAVVFTDFIIIQAEQDFEMMFPRLITIDKQMREKILRRIRSEVAKSLCFTNL